MSEMVTVYCPWVRSARTPCVIRDGERCYSPHRDDPERQCVGCGAPPEAIGLELGRQQRLGWRV
jgi:hypothetical protein